MRIESAPAEEMTKSFVFVWLFVPRTLGPGIFLFPVFAKKREVNVCRVKRS